MPTETTPLVTDLLAVLDVEEQEADLFLGRRKNGGQGRVFGGQVVAQALAAATRTVDANKGAHSLHANFMRPGDEQLPIAYRVDRDFDGGTFATRRVTAMQKEQPILTLTASFQRLEDGLHHQAAMPDVPTPDSLPTRAQLIEKLAVHMPQSAAALIDRPSAFDMRPVGTPPFVSNRPGPPEYRMWFRLDGEAPDDPLLHRALLAYASDYSLLATALAPHPASWVHSRMQMASLDHAIWFHGQVRVDQWLLYSCDTPWAGNGRGLARGNIFTADGRLIASVAQEGLIRVRDGAAGLA